MAVTLSEQLSLTLASALIGMALGFIWDIARVFRIVIGFSAGMTFLFDLLFFGFCSAVDFVFLLEHSDGTVRMYLILFQLLGFFLFRFGCSPFLDRVLFPAVRFLIRLVCAIGKAVLWPIRRFFTGIGALLKKVQAKMIKYGNKSTTKSKNLLKRHQIMLYNLFASKSKLKKSGKAEMRDEKEGSQAQ